MNPNPNDNFEFYLSQTNKIKPQMMKKIDMVNLIKSNRTNEINELIMDISQENFEENEYYDLNKNELKLIKAYQVLTQYMVYSVNHLTKKNQLLNDLSGKQVNYNQEAEKIIQKQQRKLKEQEASIGELTNNCINMEYLIKELHLEDAVNSLGVDVKGNNDTLTSKQYNDLHKDMTTPDPKDLEGK